MPLTSLSVILVRTRFPENIGMAARACANMGCSSLRLVRPERWDYAKAAPLATQGGISVLDDLTVYASLDDALFDQHLALGSTARTGGWRKSLLGPGNAAQKLSQVLKAGQKAALVFGPEDSGLDNSEIAKCSGLINIPTYGANSLNLAQAVLILLYECAKLGQSGIIQKRGGPPLATLSELQLLERKLRASLSLLHCAQNGNDDYYFLAWHRLISRAALRRHEFDILMGFCRQLENYTQIRKK